MVKLADSSLTEKKKKDFSNDQLFILSQIQSPSPSLPLKLPPPLQLCWVTLSVLILDNSKAKKERDFEGMSSLPLTSFSKTCYNAID